MIEIEKKNPLEGLTFIDLFSGIGAYHQALSSYGASCVFACDVDRKARETYKLNYGITPQTDITAITATAIPKHDILCAGFPCQPFSISGKQAGFADTTKGTLFFDVARIIEHHRPPIVLLENVKHLVNHNNGKTMKTIKETLENLDYTVFYQVLNAADYGIPQARERVYIVAFHKSIGVSSFKFPAKIPLAKHLQDILESDCVTKRYIVKRPDIELRTGVTEVLKNRPIQLGHYTKQNRQGYRIYSSKGTAITFTSSSRGAGGQVGLYRINGVIRKLSPRESARCMGFPDTFVLPEKKTTAWRLLGNSIVVDVLQYIIEEIIKLPEVQTYISKEV